MNLHPIAHTSLTAAEAKPTRDMRGHDPTIVKVDGQQAPRRRLYCGDNALTHTVNGLPGVRCNGTYALPAGRHGASQQWHQMFADRPHQIVAEAVSLRRREDMPSHVLDRRYERAQARERTG